MPISASTTLPIRERLRHVYLRGIVMPGLRWSGPAVTDRLARHVGRGLYRVGPPLRDVAMRRATAALGRERNAVEIARIVESSFEHAARFWGESLFVRRQLARGDWRRHVSVAASSDSIERDDPTGLDDFARAARGAIVTTPYFGNPIVAAVVLGRIFGRVHVPADFARHGMFGAWSRDLRDLSFVRIVDRSEGVAPLEGALESREAILLIGTHHRHRGPGVRATWLGREITAYATIGVLAARHDVPVLPIVCRREGNPSRFAMSVEGAIEPRDFGHEPREITSANLRRLERAVMQTPEQYLWAMAE